MPVDSEDLLTCQTVPVKYNIVTKLRHGMYLLYKDGHLYSHSNEHENNRPDSWLTFKKGDVVSISLDPETGQVSYQTDGSPPFIQDTDIRSTTDEAVHFCAMLRYQGNDISIV